MKRGRTAEYRAQFGRFRMDIYLDGLGRVHVERSDRVKPHNHVIYKDWKTFIYQFFRSYDLDAGEDFVTNFAADIYNEIGAAAADEAFKIGELPKRMHWKASLIRRRIEANDKPIKDIEKVGKGRYPRRACVYGGTNYE